MYKTILMPTDGSECSQQAITQGLELARSMGASVRFVYALENPTSAMWISPESLPYGMELLEDLKKVGQTAVDKAMKMAAESGVSAEAKLVEGRPVDVILEAARSADLIVMGTHGRSGLDRFMLGSVTESVLHKASKPVLVMRSR